MNFSFEQFAGVKFGEMMAVVIKIDRAADQLAPGSMRREGREVHAVVDKARFVA